MGPTFETDHNQRASWMLWMITLVRSLFAFPFRFWHLQEALENGATLSENLVTRALLPSEVLSKSGHQEVEEPWQPIP
jgi:hypothetical protein